MFRETVKRWPQISGDKLCFQWKWRERTSTSVGDPRPQSSVISTAQAGNSCEDTDSKGNHSRMTWGSRGEDINQRPRGCEGASMDETWNEAVGKDGLTRTQLSRQRASYFCQNLISRKRALCCRETGATWSFTSQHVLLASDYFLYLKWLICKYCTSCQTWDQIAKMGRDEWFYLCPDLEKSFISHLRQLTILGIQLAFFLTMQIGKCLRIYFRW